MLTFIPCISYTAHIRGSSQSLIAAPKGSFLSTPAFGIAHSVRSAYPSRSSLPLVLAQGYGEPPSDSSPQPEAVDYDDNVPYSPSRPYQQSQERTDFASVCDELRSIFDRDMTNQERIVLIQDIAKRSPEIFKMAAEKSSQTVGLEDFSEFVQQVRDDVLPEVRTAAPEIASAMAAILPTELSNVVSRIPKMTQKESLPKMVFEHARNIFQKTPTGLETPYYDVLSQAEEYEVRYYATYSVVETILTRNGYSGQLDAVAATASGDAFNALASYLFGSNTEGEVMKMTTPVTIERTVADDQASSATYSEKDIASSVVSKMTFVLPSAFTVDSAPKPLTDDIIIRDTDPQITATISFSGIATENEIQRKLSRLLDALDRDKVKVVDPSSYYLLQYNPPYTLPWLRRNEISVRVLWPADKMGSQPL